MPDLQNAMLREIDLSSANLRDVVLNGSDLKGAILRRVNLRRAHLLEADMRGANLSAAILPGANLDNADLSLTNLAGASLHNTSFNNASLYKANLVMSNLRGASLYRVKLHKANLYQAFLRAVNLVEADLSESNLTRTNFSESDLREANLRRSDLREANFQVTSLDGVDFREAILTRTNLSETCLREADLSMAIFFETILANADLTSTKGLDACIHHGPSTIDHRTLVQSGPLPLAFLRGCGLPDALIDYLPSLLNEPIQLYSCFISYSHQDEAFATRLYDALQGKGVRCWYAPEDMKGGKKLHEQIDAAIRIHDKLLLVLSEHSMQSEWVKTEIANARQREVSEGKRMLFPIRLVDFETIRNWSCFDADTGKDSVREIREYFIPDFSNWKDHDAFEAAFDRLLRDLKADETQT